MPPSTAGGDQHSNRQRAGLPDRARNMMPDCPPRTHAPGSEPRTLTAPAPMPLVEPSGLGSAPERAPRERADARQRSTPVVPGRTPATLRDGEALRGRGDVIL